MINALSVDVEDYHNVLALDRLGVKTSPTRAVVENTVRLMELFYRYNARATFFILGEVAETFPELIRSIVAGGHELGVHGYDHKRVFQMTPEEFRTEIGKAKAIIEDVAGIPAHGYRAPAFSIMPKTRWAFDVLADLGFRFDSSVFPIAGRRYGWPGFCPDIHEITLDSGRKIVEVPMSAVSIVGCAVPACGGGYLRHFPLTFTRWAIRRIHRKRPAVVYLHPYEIELTGKAPQTDGLGSGAARRLRRFHRLQLRNRHTVEGKIVRLLGEFQFAPLSKVIGQVLS